MELTLLVKKVSNLNLTNKDHFEIRLEQIDLIKRKIFESYLLTSFQLLKAIKIKSMLRWTLSFIVIALIAGVLGFGGIAGAAAGIAKFTFYIFLVLVALSLISSIFKKS